MQFQILIIGILSFLMNVSMFWIFDISARHANTLDALLLKRINRQKINRFSFIFAISTKHFFPNTYSINLKSDKSHSTINRDKLFKCFPRIFYNHNLVYFFWFVYCCISSYVSEDNQWNSKRPSINGTFKILYTLAQSGLSKYLNISSKQLKCTKMNAG